MPLARVRLGRSGEIAAAAELGRRGYEIVTSNYRGPHGEIDLIARDGDCLVFVEVRCKRNANFGTPAESVTPAKQRKIAATAQHYLDEHNIKDVDCRFDVVEVMPQNGKLTANVITNAFEVQ